MSVRLCEKLSINGDTVFCPQPECQCVFQCYCPDIKGMRGCLCVNFEQADLSEAILYQKWHKEAVAMSKKKV